MTSFEQTIRALHTGEKFFSRSLPVHIARAPGRLDVMGGNVDYSGGLVFEAPIREATWAASQLRSDSTIHLINPQMSASGWQSELSLPLTALHDEAALRAYVNSSPSIRWTAYVLGVFHLLLKRYPQQANCGLTLYLHSEVPLNKGVSSSAAVEVATMKAALATYGIPLHGIELAEACQWVENVIAESACGIMDQAASVLGKDGHILPLLCQPCQLAEPVKLPGQLALWAIDSGVKHAVTGIEYEAARAAGFIGYSKICALESLPITKDISGTIPRFVDPFWNGYLCNIAPSLFRSRFESHLPEKISGDELLASHYSHPDPFTAIRPGVTYPVRACTRYAVEEQHRIELFVELMRSLATSPSPRAFRLLGDLMFQSHWSYTECGLGAPETDLIISLVRDEMARDELGPAQLYGAKITGGGAGGTVAILGAQSAKPHFERVVARYAEHTGSMPYVFEGSSQGADEFGIIQLDPLA
jgi:L-arabinokinase